MSRFGSSRHLTLEDARMFTLPLSAPQRAAGGRRPTHGQVGRSHRPDGFEAAWRRGLLVAR